MKKKEEPIRIAQIVGKWLGGGVEAVVMNYYRHLDQSLNKTALIVRKTHFISNHKLLLLQ